MHSGDINNCGNFIRQFFFLDFRRINEPDAVAEFCADLLVVSSVKNHHGLNSNAVNISGCIKAPFRPRCFGAVWRGSRYLVSRKVNQNSRKKYSSPRVISKDHSSISDPSLSARSN